MYNIDQDSLLYFNWNISLLLLLLIVILLTHQLIISGGEGGSDFDEISLIINYVI